MNIEKRKKSLIILLFLTIVGLGLVGGLINTQVQAYDANILRQFEILREILFLIRDAYVEETDPVKLIDGAIDGLLAKLDPHSVYLQPKDFEKMKENFQGNYEGIGISFDIRDGYLTVIAPLEGSPSEKVGIRTGDKIIKIDGKSAIGITQEEVYRRLRGPAGTTVVVTVKRIGESDPLDFKIVRAKNPILSIPYAFMIRPGIGYIRLIRFAQTSGKELDYALAKLDSLGMRKLIFDLRRNSGGILDQGVEVTSKFVANNDMVVYTKSRFEDSRRNYRTHGNGNYTNLPIIVMIDHGSASASEIVAGAIQDSDRGLIVGQTSFGKGLVQNPFVLKNGNVLLLTVARWYTPSGRLIQRPYTDNKADYVENALKEETEVDTSSSQKPVFYTLTGRKVYGGGGIRPDVILKPDTLTVFEGQLLRNDIFFDFADMYARNIHFSNFDQFLKGFTSNDEMISDFKKLLSEKKIAFKESEINQSRDFITRNIKQEIAGHIWTDHERYRVALEGDDQVLKAIELFDQTVALLQKRTKHQNQR